MRSSPFSSLSVWLGRFFGWAWMDPVAGFVDAAVIVRWSWALIRDTGGILMNMIPDRNIADAFRAPLEQGCDKVLDLHQRQPGPGHLGAILSIATPNPHESHFYRERLAGFPSLSHVTIKA